MSGKFAYYSGFDDSGQKPYWDDFYTWLDENKPGRGKFDKTIIKDPANSAVATAARASMEAAQRSARQNFTIDPEIAKNAPGVIAAQMNQGDQDIAAAHGTAMLGAIANAQEGAANRQAARRMGIYELGANARMGELSERAKQMQAVKKTNPWLAALQVGAGLAANFI